MTVYIFYIFLSPLLYCLLLFLSIFNTKIRINYFTYSKRLSIVKRYIQENKKNKKIFLFHAASTGEFEQLKPILRLIDREKYFIVQSFTSPTIYNEEKDSTLCDITCYHPFDIFWLSRNFFTVINPDKYIITRHDIWPGHIITAHYLRIPIYYINANIHKNSIWFNNYFRFISRYILNLINIILVPSKTISNNLSTIQISRDKVIVTGDSRLDQILYRKKMNQNVNILPDVLLASHATIFGSIDTKDMDIIFPALKKNYPLGTESLKNNKHYLIFAPHEINTYAMTHLMKKLDQLLFSYIQFSKINNNSNDNVIIIDKVGYLAELYKYANQSYVGGGFSKGIHSVIEPAVYNNKISCGPNIEMLDEAKKLVKINSLKIINSANEMYDFIQKDSQTLEQNTLDYNNFCAADKILDQIIL